jgi:hypothetical protein
VLKKVENDLREVLTKDARYLSSAAALVLLQNRYSRIQVTTEDIDESLSEFDEGERKIWMILEEIDEFPRY